MGDLGGLFGKLGIRYEDRWAVHCVFAMLQEQAEAIRLEPTGPDGDGVEFWLRCTDHREYHQAKRQRSADGHWSISALRTTGVLATFLEKLQDPTARCVFVSGHPAPELEGLGLRATAAVSRTEFDDLLRNNQLWKGHYDQLVAAWGGADGDTVFSALQRITVRGTPEPDLVTLNELEASVVLAGDLVNAVAVLTDLLRTHPSAYLTASDIWRLLKPKGYTPNPWRSSTTLAEQVAHANARFIRSRERTLIGRALIHRPEADALRSMLDERKVVVVDGAAGMGKSDVLLQFVRDLDADGIPFLAFRLDQAKPTRLPHELGHELGLPGSPPTVLAALAANSEQAVMVIDQLDIVSTTSGRSPEFFDCVEEMVELAAMAPNLRVVLSCRTFDLDNDSRIRRIVPAEDPRPVVTIGALASGQLAEALGTVGVDAASLTIKQRTLLAVPLHLALLTEILEPGGDRASALTFATAGDLYKKFWTVKQQELQTRLGRPPAWTQILDRLVDDMSGHERLRSPREIADEWELDVRAMVSSRVLIDDGTHLSFFHETFFDYVFARRFTARGHTVAGLLAQDQLLFRRAQVRQIMAYNRGRAEGYVDDLAFLLTDPGVRYHLRDLVMAWLGQIDPTEDEWQLLHPHLDDPDSFLHDRAWQTMASPAWLRVADTRGYATAWLQGPLVDRAVRAIGLASDEFGDRAAELLYPYKDDPDWSPRIAWIVGRSDLGKSPALLELCVELMDSGALDDHGFTRSDFWYVAHDLPASAPEQANRLLGRFLANRMRAAQEAGLAHPFAQDADVIASNLHLLDYVKEAAAKAPAAFVLHVWPPMLTIINAALLPEYDGRLRRDDVWYFRHLSDAYGGLDDHLLHGAEVAFRALAVESPAAFATLAGALHGTTSETAVYLLLEGYAANPDAFADRALDALAADRRWLQVPYSDGHAWQTRRLIQAVTPAASDGAIARLETTLLAHYPRGEKSVSGYRQFGRSQFTLLAGVSFSRRTPVMRKRLAEWQRKFLCDDVAAPEGVVGGSVRSPIAAASAAKVSDRQWLQAMRRHDSNDFYRRRSFFIGGAHQLASVLETRAAAEPDRFAALATEMPDDANASYFDAILRGVAENADGATFDLTVALLLRCHALPDRPTGRWIAGPLRHHLDRTWPHAVITMLEWYAMNDPSPQDDPDEDADDRPTGEALAGRGLNSVRGGIAHEIAHFIWDHPEHVEPLTPAIDSLVADPAMAVRSMAADIAVAFLRDDPARALDLLDRMLLDSTDDLFAIRSVINVMRYRLGPDYGRVRPHIERMIVSADETAQTNGAVLASIAALTEELARDLADPCASGTEPQRIGAAKVAAANLTSARFRDRCRQQLITFFDDPSKTVREAAASVMRHFEGDELGDYPDLILAFNESRAGGEHVDELLFALSHVSTVPTEIALGTCAGFLQRLAAVEVDGRIGQAARADDVSQLLVRIYVSGDSAVKERALDLIDHSLQLNIYGAARSLAEHDRPWLVAGS